jgi:hypothetical protein
MFLTLKSFAMPQRGGLLLLAAATFAAGLSAGALIAPGSAGRGDAVAAIQTREALPASALRSGHPAEVVRVIDGDTFEAGCASGPAWTSPRASACAASTRRNCTRVATTNR